MTPYTLPAYYSIERLIEAIDEPARTACERILRENRELFETSQGSTYNHQAWHGGYIDHITDTMNLAERLYDFLGSFGRPLPFTKSSALLVMFIHDLEKPWRIEALGHGIVRNKPGLETKEQFAQFRNKKLEEYGLVLTPEEQNAFRYVEGEYKDYKSTERVMNELGAFCHMVDTWSARGWHSYPLERGDPWLGARRIRTLA
jgi:hypothetical protein